MADILLMRNRPDDFSAMHHDAVEQISTDPQLGCWIHGKEGTFCLVRDGEDAIASMGYVCHVDGESMQVSLKQILKNFMESRICELKKELVGQYVLLIKKDKSIFIFSDFLGARNVFYTDDGQVVSSSFSQVEDQLHSTSSDLDMYKVYEFLAMRHILYPAMLGRSTFNRHIKWLLPYEYIAIDVANSNFRIGSIVYSIDNKKQSDCTLLANELLDILRTVISRKEFKSAKVAATLTGGQDSRLIAAVAAEQYRDIHYRIAISSEDSDAMKDMDVASCVARVKGIALDIYRFKSGRDEEKFRELTEGFSPVYNQTVAPLLEGSGDYSLGLGGVFGTELFMPIPWTSIDEYIQAKIDEAKKALKVEDGFWKYFSDSLYEEFGRTKEHYHLTDRDDRDYIRLFCMLDTARYASFILSAFNRFGYQLDPYGSYAVLELALRVAPSQWGNHKRFGGKNLVQKTAMAKLNPRIARVMTYRHYRPMSPLSLSTFPFYLIGFTIQVGDWLKRKLVNKITDSKRSDMPGGYYLADGWEQHFLGRTVEKYGVPMKSPENMHGSNKT